MKTSCGPNHKAPDFRFKGGSLPTLMKRVGAVLAGLVCLASADVRADLNSPLLDGDYQVGTFGVLRLSSTAIPSSQNKVERFSVKGSYVKGDKCGFAPSELLLEGVTEGSVLIATFTTCVEGSGCQSPSKLSLMAMIAEGSLTGYLSLPQGCEAKGLEHRVTMQLSADSLRAAGTAFLRAPPNFERAAAVFKRLSELPEGRNDLEVLNLLGSAYNGAKQYQEGRKVFERARTLSGFQTAKPELRALLLYNLGCSEASLSEKEPGLADQAIEHLRQASQIKNSGLDVKNDAAADGDLAPLRSNPEFLKLLGLKKGLR